jgi:hypothetical protein
MGKPRERGWVSYSRMSIFLLNGKGTVFGAACHCKRQRCGPE